jgi:NRPS condensation-like uncharacterized protein
MFDQMQFFFQEYNDHQLHGAIYFAGRLDRECLKKAVSLSMDLVPILRSRYVESAWHPFWESMRAGHDDDVVACVDTDCIKEEIDRFLTGKTDEFRGPQLMVRIVGGPDRDALCIVMNHMVCDGAGFKEYLYLLSSLYTNLRRDPDYRPSDAPGGSRSINQVYRQLRLRDRLKLLFTRKDVTRHDSGLAFPLSGIGDKSPFIATHKLLRSRFQVLKEYGKKYGVTINDIVLAAYLRALSRVMEIPPGKRIIMPCAIDLRRFITGGKAEAICNLTSTIICDIGAEIGYSFDDTVIRVKQDMDVKKGGFGGLNGLVFLDILFKLVPYTKVKPLFKEKFINPVLFITNIGVIDKSRLAFDNLPVLDAFVTGSIKYPPYFQLALTSFDEAITFSINLYGTASDREQTENFLRILDDELQNNAIDNGVRGDVSK